jgi:hypothetical protein
VLFWSRALDGLDPGPVPTERLARLDRDLAIETRTCPILGAWLAALRSTIATAHDLDWVIQFLMKVRQTWIMTTTFRGRLPAPNDSSCSPMTHTSNRRNVPEAARATILAVLPRKTRHAAALPDPLPMDQVLIFVDGTQQTTEKVRACAGQDDRGYFLDYYKTDSENDVSWHGRIRDDGTVENLENFEGQFGWPAFPDPADTERERQRIRAHNERVEAILNKKGFV